MESPAPSFHAYNNYYCIANLSNVVLFLCSTELSHVSQWSVLQFKKERCNVSIVFTIPVDYVHALRFPENT